MKTVDRVILGTMPGATTPWQLAYEWGLQSAIHWVFGEPPRRDDDLVFVTQNSRNVRKEKGLHRCNPLIIWRARQESNPRPPGS